LNDDQPITAIRFHEDALASFREAGDELAIAQTIDLLGMDYIILGDLVTAERVLRDAISAFELMGEHVALSSAFSSYALTTGTLGFEQELPTQYPALSAETVLSRAVSLARETHWRAGEAFAYCISGSYHTVRGQFDRALGDINLALSIAREIEHKEWETYSLDLVASTYLQLL